MLRESVQDLEGQVRVGWIRFEDFRVRVHLLWVFERKSTSGSKTETMIIGLLEIECSIPESHSLKDKRQIIRSLRDRILHAMNVSVAETGRQDAHQFTEMAFITISAQADVVDKRLAKVREMIGRNPRLVVLDMITQHL